MAKRLRTLGIILTVFGLVLMVVGGVAYAKVQEGYGSLQKFSEAQNVTLSYNEDGQLTDRGTTEGAEAIKEMLTDKWGFPVVESDLDPNDPLINTATEYMYQMAVIGYHVMHGTQTVVLTEDVTYNDEVFPAGEYEVQVNQVGDADRVAAGLGGYWTDFDRRHPLEGPARSQAWSGTAHGLFGELGVGAVTHSALQMGLGLAAAFAVMGLLSIFAGGGLFWASREKEEEIKVAIPETIPDTAMAS